jgi:drug/metabolite transporter (DMT)-like permease
MLSLFTAPFGWVIPPLADGLMLVCAGLVGSVGQILLTTSYRYADASLLAPFDYTSLILALLVGYFVFSEVPTVTMLIGAAVVIFAGLLVIWRERRLGLLERRKTIV